MTLSAITRAIKKEFPDFEIKKKSDSTFMKVLDFLLKVVTFGQMKKFMTGFITTMGVTVYVHERWDKIPESARVAVLRHERVHMRQAKKYGRFVFSFLYLLIPLPLFFAYYRSKFEMEAYAESMKAVAEDNGMATLMSPVYRKAMISHFTSAQYGWMWVRRSRIEKWYDQTVAQLRVGLG